MISLVTLNGCGKSCGERLREKLRTDSDRIQREIEEYGRLSQQVMQLTKTIFENVEKVRASVKPQEKE